MPTPSISCVYCDASVSRTQAKQYTCPKCWKSMIAQFGDRWFDNDWHRELLPDAMRFQNESDKLDRAIRLDANNAPDVTIDNIVLPAEARTVRHPEVLRAVATLYVTSRLGARKIKQHLDAQGVQPVVSLPTVSNYLKLIKVALAATEERQAT